MFYSYIIQSELSGRWYYGSSENPFLRLQQHNANANKSTKNRGPWKLIFLREFPTKKEAVAFELQLKSFKNKNYMQRVFVHFFLPTPVG